MSIGLIALIAGSLLIYSGFTNRSFAEMIATQPNATTGQTPVIDTKLMVKGPQ